MNLMMMNYDDIQHFSLSALLDSLNLTVCTQKQFTVLISTRGELCNITYLVCEKSHNFHIINPRVEEKVQLSAPELDFFFNWTRLCQNLHILIKFSRFQFLFKWVPIKMKGVLCWKELFDFWHQGLVSAFLCFSLMDSVSLDFDR